MVSLFTEEDEVELYKTTSDYTVYVITFYKDSVPPAQHSRMNQPPIGGEMTADGKVKLTEKQQVC